ncbi:MAG: hypothetical protein GF353_05990, partial [Candidatus Lokiarchaeota archaeon]|nr:hypothetical protein [Candidatus Lokiarchaeota archaeon]
MANEGSDRSNEDEYKIILTEPFVTKGDSNIFYADAPPSFYSKRYYITEEDTTMWILCLKTGSYDSCKVPNENKYPYILKDGQKYFYRIIANMDNVEKSAITWSYQDQTPPTVEVDNLPHFVNNKKFQIHFEANDFVCNELDTSIYMAKLYSKFDKHQGWDVGDILIKEFNEGPFSTTITTKDSFDFSDIYRDDGFYELYVKAYDQARKQDKDKEWDGNYEIGFNSENAKTYTFVDTKHPVSEITKIDSTQSSTTFEIGYEAIDPANGQRNYKSGLKKIKLFYAYKFEPDDNYTDFQSLDYNLRPHNEDDTLISQLSFDADMGDGTYKFYTIAIDSAGNEQTEKIKYDSTIVDTEVPDIEDLSVYQDPTKTQRLSEEWQNECNTPYLEWSASYGVSGVYFNVSIIRDGDGKVILDSVVHDFYLNVASALDDGKYNIIVKPESGSGISGNPISFTLRYDRTPPEADVQELNTVYSDSLFDIHFVKVNDNLSQVASIKLCYQYRAKDDAEWSEKTEYPDSAANNEWFVSFNINKASGEGYYRFGSIAIDSAKNEEICQTYVETYVDLSALAPPVLVIDQFVSTKESIEVEWRQSSQDKVHEIKIQCSDSDNFPENHLLESGWIKLTVDTNYIFNSNEEFIFEDAQAYYFRAQYRDSNGDTSKWSTPEKCTTDYSPPVIILPEPMEGIWTNQSELT